MNPVSILWPMIGGACLTLAVVQLLVRLHNRGARANLWLALLGFAVAGIVAGELAMMFAETPDAFARATRWIHVPIFFAFVGIVRFVAETFGSARNWLGWTVIGVRAFSLALNFLVGPNLNHVVVTGLKPVEFLGGTVMTAEAVFSQRTRFGELATLLLLVFVVDAAWRLWRKGAADPRRSALLTGGSVTAFVFAGLIQGVLIHSGAVAMPYLISVPFLIVVGVMTWELSRDLLRSAGIAEELRERAESMRLAAGAARIAFWHWDIASDRIWVNPQGRGLYGLREGVAINLERFLSSIHPDDRERVRHAVGVALEGGDSDGGFRADYRVEESDGVVHCMEARGRLDFNGGGKPVRMRGISIDVSDRRDAEKEAQQHRNELARVNRVTTLNEFSGAIAHEMNQPLAIILANAQAAQRMLGQSSPDLDEVKDILADIVAEDRRAGEVIQRLWALLKRGETNLLPLSLNEIAGEMLDLTHADLVGRGVTVTRDLSDGLPAVAGDRVQLQQVLLNLVLNGADAMAANPPGSRRLHVATESRDGVVRLSVRDGGCGLPADVERLFEPFYTTKLHGLGMGLAICRSIVAAHGGSLRAEPDPDGGAVFHLEIPALW